MKIIFLHLFFSTHLRCARPKLMLWCKIKAPSSKSIISLFSFPLSKHNAWYTAYCTHIWMWAWCWDNTVLLHSWSETHTVNPLSLFSQKLNSPWKIWAVYKLFSCTQLGSEAVESASIFSLPLDRKWNGKSEVKSMFAYNFTAALHFRKAGKAGLNLFSVLTICKERE